MTSTAVIGWLALAARVWLPQRGAIAWRYAAAVSTVMFAVVSGTWFAATRLAAGEAWSPGGLAILVITPQVALLLAALSLLGVIALWPLLRAGSRQAAAPALTAAVAFALAIAAVVTPARPPLRRRRERRSRCQTPPSRG